MPLKSLVTHLGKRTLSSLSKLMLSAQEAGMGQEEG